MIHHVIYHDDLDSRCAAAIVLRSGYANAKYYSMRYGDSLPSLKGGDSLILLGITFPPITMAAWAKHCNLTWIDGQNALTNDVNKALSEANAQWAGPILLNESVAYNTFLRFEPSFICSTAIRLISKYSMRETIGSQLLMDEKDPLLLWEALLWKDTKPESIIWDRLFMDSNYLKRLLRQGSQARERSLFSWNIALNNAYEAEWSGYKLLAVCGQSFGPPCLDQYKDIYDFIAIYSHNGDKFIVSLQGWGKIDLGNLARSCGGGGNFYLADFSCQTLPWRRIRPLFEKIEHVY